MSCGAESEATNSTSGLRRRKTRQSSHEDSEQVNDLASQLTTSEWRETASDVNDALREVKLSDDTLTSTGEKNAPGVGEDVEELTKTIQNVSITDGGHIFSSNEVDKVGGILKQLISHAFAPEQQKRIGSNIISFIIRGANIGTRLAANPVVQQEFNREYEQDPESVNDVLEPPKNNSSLSRPTSGRGGGGDPGGETNEPSGGGCSGQRSWFQFLVDAFWWIYSKAKGFFSKMMEIGAELVEAIVNGLRWLLNALVDPVGQVFQLLNDPEALPAQKILGVASLVASCILIVLIPRSGRIPRPLINTISVSYVASAARNAAGQSGNGVEVPRDD